MLGNSLKYGGALHGTAILAVAVVALLFAGRTLASPDASDARARELGRSIVSEEGLKSRMEKVFASLDTPLAARINKSLDVTDPAKKEKVGIIVHNDIHALLNDLVEIRISTLAQVYTVHELEGMLAFSRSPTGQAVHQAAPALSRELSAAFYGGAPATVDPPPSEQRLALIIRILRAQNVEGDTRRVWHALSAVVTTALPNAGGGLAPSSTPAKDQADEDDYVKLMVAAETHFYATNFSDAQLADLAAYFDGPIGRASRDHRPQMAALAASDLSKAFERRFGHIEAAACEAVDCNASQKAELDAGFGLFRSMVGQAVGMIGPE